MGVAPEDVELIRLAGAHYRFEAHRLQAAWERFGLRPTPFYQRVNALLEDPDVALAEPVIVARLRRRRDRLAAVKRAG